MDTRILFVGGALVALGGCSKLLDLPDRQVDPSFSTTSPGAQGGAAGAAGAGGTAGEAGAAGEAGEAGAGGTAGSAGAGGAAGSGGSAGMGAAGAKLHSCDEYCALVASACQPPYQLYASTTLCLLACADLPAGAVDKPEENSVFCRYQQAEKAANTMKFADYCPPAGPGGGTDSDGPVCGSNCDGYCTLMQQACPGVFADENSCQKACANIPDLGGYNKTIQAGNSVQCRLYHVTAALQGPDIHCPHAAGKALCVNDGM